jgi:hypothetical protein
MHPVDKVHVGVARRAEHDPVPIRLTEPGVRGEVVPATVRLDLDDPADSPAATVVTDEQRPEKASCGVECRSREDRSVEDRGPPQRNE